MTMRVSVIVPTFKRPDLLERCLHALVIQDIPPTDYEVIIVDDGACSETKKQVERWTLCARLKKRTVRYLPVVGAHHGPAAARNVGVHAAHGEILAFTDDDCIPEQNWLKAGIAAFSDGVAGVSGRIVVPLPEAPSDYEYNASHLEHSEFATANCFYRRETFVSLGGFDEHFTAPWREDSDLFLTLLECYARYATAPDAIVIHPVRRARWGESLRQQRKSMFNALLYKKHPMLYHSRIQAHPPWHYYGIVGALLIALLGITRKSRLQARIGFCAWMYLTARFCSQRLKHTSRTPSHVMEMLVTSLAIPPLAIFWRLRGAIKFRVFFL